MVVKGAPEELYAQERDKEEVYYKIRVSLRDSETNALN